MHIFITVKPDSKPYQAPLKWVAYTLQKPFKEELEKLQKQVIIAPLGINKTSEWCNSFVLVPKANGMVTLYLEPAWLNQALIRPLHSISTLNDILPKLINAKYLSIIDASSGYHNLKLDEKSSYFTMFACQFGRYRYNRFSLGEAPAGDMLQRKMDEIFKDMPQVFSIADDILFAGYKADGKDHDKTVWSVLQRCREVNLKLNKGKCHFRCTSVPFFGEVISQNGVKQDLQKIKAFVEMPTPNNRKELQAFLGIIKYLGKIFPSTASRVVWTWNKSYQTLYSKAKLLIKKDEYMKFYDETKPLYLKTDAFQIELVPLCCKLEMVQHVQKIPFQTTLS